MSKELGTKMLPVLWRSAIKLVAGMAQQFAGLTREGIGHQAGALDEPGVAKAGAVAGFLSVHQADPHGPHRTVPA